MNEFMKILMRECPNTTISFKNGMVRINIPETQTNSEAPTLEEAIEGCRNLMVYCYVINAKKTN